MNETVTTFYLVEWESQHEPGLWLGKHLFQYDTFEEAALKYVEKVTVDPKVNWRIVKYTVTARLEVVKP